MSNELFNKLNAINVKDKVEKKGRFNYLSWSWAWAEFKKQCPNATYEIKKFGENQLPYVVDEKTGYMVFTSITVDGLTHEMWLPVMDFNNKAIQIGRATMYEINKTIMRCLTKNIAMFGLGLYIYAGEDYPEEDDGNKQITTNPMRKSNLFNPQKAIDELINLQEKYEFSKEEFQAILEGVGIKTLKVALKESEYKKAVEALNDVGKLGKGE